MFSSSTRCSHLSLPFHYCCYPLALKLQVYHFNNFIFCWSPCRVQTLCNSSEWSVHTCWIILTLRLDFLEENLFLTLFKKNFISYSSPTWFTKLSALPVFSCTFGMLMYFACCLVKYNNAKSLLNFHCTLLIKYL